MDSDQTYDVLLALESEEESAPVEEEHAHADEEDHDHASETAAGSTADEITEVTSCHAHTDALYCIVGSEEWEVTTDVDLENAPESYSGCHAHGDDELYVL